MTVHPGLTCKAHSYCNPGQSRTGNPGQTETTLMQLCLTELIRFVIAAGGMGDGFTKLPAEAPEIATLPLFVGEGTRPLVTRNLKCLRGLLIGTFDLGHAYLHSRHSVL